MSQAADYVVVGGGTAGAFVARRLADAGADVLVLEEGPSAEHDERVLHLDQVQRQWGSALMRDHPIEPTPGGNDDLLISRGVVLGGCSSHNGCVAFLPSPEDFDDWAEHGATGWEADAMREALRRVLAVVSLEEALPRHPSALAFVSASVSAGFSLTDFSRAPAHAGIGWHQLNKRGRLRQSSAVARLFPLDALPPTLRICTEARALELVLASADVIGVRTDRGVVHAQSEVVVCAGALGSPELLLRSGIGPSEHLARVGVPVAHDLPGVGEHLLDHPESTVMWSAARPVPLDSVNHLEASLFASTSGDGRADVQVMFGTARLEPIVQTLAAAAGVAVPEHVLAMYPNVARARSRGTVRLRSADPADGLRVDPRYYTDPDGRDIGHMIEGIRLARRVAAEPALARWIAREIAPGAALQRDEDLAAYARRAGGTVYHQAGSCRMGAATDRDAVVDPLLRVRGVGGVRVADASVFPSMPAVNPCLTCMAVGERCAELILDGS